MKKLLFFFVMLVIGSVTFAQHFFVEGNVTADFESVTPNIGIGIGFRPLDIMVGINFTVATEVTEEIYQYTYYDGYNNYKANYFGFSESGWLGGIYAGVALKPLSTEKWMLSFPILTQIRFGGISGIDYNYGNMPVEKDSLEKASLLGVDLVVGTRVAYSLSEHWSVFTGFVFNFIEVTEYQYTRYKTEYPAGGTYPGTKSSIGMFSSGKVQLGVRFTI